MPLVIDSGSTLEQLDAFTDAMAAGRSVVVTHSQWGDPARARVEQEIKRAKELADDRFPPNGRLIVFTAGSSGTPRAVVRTIDSWQAAVDPFTRLTGLGGNDVVWAPGPLSSTLSLYAGWHARRSGNRVVLGYRPHPNLLGHVTLIHTVPSMLRALADAHAAGMLPKLRRIVVAGDVVPEVAHRGWRGRGVELAEYYGAAELSFTAWRQEDGLHAFPGAEIEIRDDRLWVRSPYLSLGYLTPDPTASLEMVDGWATVGDRATWIDQEAGSFQLVGRADATVQTGEHTVDAAAVEAALLEVPGAEHVVVMGVPHPELGEIVTAVMTGAVDHAHLRQAVAALPETERPTRWSFPARLPLTVGGKVDRAMVRVALLDRDLGTRPLPTD